MSTGSGHFELSDSGFAHMFGQIRRIKVKFLIKGAVSRNSAKLGCYKMPR